MKNAFGQSRLRGGGYERQQLWLSPQLCQPEEGAGLERGRRDGPCRKSAESPGFLWARDAAMCVTGGAAGA